MQSKFETFLSIIKWLLNCVKPNSRKLIGYPTKKILNNNCNLSGPVRGSDFFLLKMFWVQKYRAGAQRRNHKYNSLFRLLSAMYDFNVYSASIYE